MASLLERATAWAERRFKMDVRYLASGSFWAAAGQFIVTLSAFAFSLVAARYIPPTIYGTYKYVIAAVSLISSFSLSGLSAAVFQSVASGYGGALIEGVWKNLRWSLGAFALALATGGYYLLVGNMVVGIGILLGGSATPLIASANLYSAYLNGKKDWRRAAFYADVVDTLLPYGALIAVAFLYPQPLALLLTYFLSNLAAIAYAYWRTLHIYRPDQEPNDPGTLTYAKHLSVLGVLGGIAASIDQVLVYHYVGAAELAVYTFATGIVDQTKGPLKSLDAMTQARFARRTDPDIASGMHTKMFWLFIVSIIFIVLYIPLAPFIYRILFPLYVSAVPYSQIYALSMLALVFSPTGSYFSAKKKVRDLYILSTLTSILSIAILFLGIYYGGLLGLVWARVAIRIGGGAGGYFVYLRSGTSGQSVA